MSELNSLANAVAQMQGVVIGSSRYRAAGLEPYASQTGGHAAYGWNHSYLVDDDFAVACVVNLLSRPLYYDGEGYRESAYNLAGRPDGWEAETPADVASGWKKGRVRYQTPSGSLTVSAPDPQHFWFDPGWSVLAARNEAPIKVMGGTLPAWRVVKWAAYKWAEALAGMLRNHGPYMAGGRATALIMNFFSQAVSHGIFGPADKRGPLEAYVDWLGAYGLPQLETAPGVREVKNEGVCRWVQECGWMLPALWDASVLAQDHKYGPRLEAERRRRSHWMLDIDKIAGGRARWYNLRVTSQMMKGEPTGAPLETLAGAITSNDVTGPDDYTLWSLRAADVARHDWPSSHAEEFYGKVRQKAVANAKGADRVWLVDKDRNYI